MTKNTPYSAAVTLIDSSASLGLADVQPVRCNGRWLEQPYLGCFVGTLGSVLDRIQVWVSPDDRNYVSVQSYTTTAFADVVNGPWPFIKFTKAGANGAGTVIGIFERT